MTGAANIQNKKQSKPARALGRWVGRVGIGVVVAMLLLCYGTLPWTWARVTPKQVSDEAAQVDDTNANAIGGGLSPRRFEAIDLDAARLPPFWMKHAEDEREAIERLKARDGRAPKYIFGTDRLGRDVFARCLAGGAISLSIGLSAALISVCIGTLYGTIAGASGPRTDSAMMRIVDIIYGLPYILLVVLLAVAADGLASRAGSDLSSGARQAINLGTLIIAIGGVSWLTLARVVRGQVLSLKEQPFMEACRAIGVGPARQFFRHLLPNLLGPITVYAALSVPTAILSESFLSFLGIGVSEPLPSWGNLASDGLSELNIVRVRWWLLLWPCLFIALTLVALNFMGEWLRERMDVKKAGVRA